MSRKKRIRRKLGDVIAVPLRDGLFGYGRVLREPLIAFYNLQSSEPLPLEKIVLAPVAFVLFVMNSAIIDGDWSVLGNIPLSADLLQEPLFFKKDSITGALSTYRDSTGEETPATREQCKGLECAAVWEPNHIADRLSDYFSGRRNAWVDDLQA